MPMSVADALDYISFFVFRCNGTTVLAEMHRVIMSNRDMYRIKASFGNHLYEFLFELAKELYPDIDGVGSCTQARYTYSAGRNDTNWCDHQHKLLSLCNSYFENSKICKSQNRMRECTQKLVHSLFKE